MIYLDLIFMWQEGAGNHLRYSNLKHQELPNNSNMNQTKTSLVSPIKSLKYFTSVGMHQVRL